MQEQVSDIMYVARRKFLISLLSPLQVIVVVPLASLSQEVLGRALQDHIDLVRMFGFNVRITFVDPFKALVALRGSIPGVEVQPTGAGDHLPRLDIRIRRLKEMARSVLNSLDYKLPLSFVNQLVTFCVSRLNVQTTSSLVGNWSPRVRMTGRKVDFKKEYALTFGEYVEARNPQAVSNSMAPRTDPCIALYPTLNVNGSWKLYNLRTKKIVSRSQYTKMKHTPDEIIKMMTLLGAKGILKPSDIIGDEPDGVEVVEPPVFEPVLQTHIPDPNVIEMIADDNVDTLEEEILPNSDEEESADVVEDLIEDLSEELEVNVSPDTVEGIETAVNPIRRSNRTTAGQSSKYVEYSMFTQGYGLACGNLSVKVALERFNKIAYDAIKDELTQLFFKKKALMPQLADRGPATYWPVGSKENLTQSYVPTRKI